VLAAWVVEEMETAELYDKRLNKRFGELLDRLGKRPMASIPAACGGAAETAAAYRFFDNENVTFEAILRPHHDATRERIASQAEVVLVQDTTEIDLTRPGQQVEGAGPLDGGARRGALLHVLHAFTPNGTALGTLHAVPLVRSDDKPANATMSRAELHRIPLEERESYRWLVGLGQAQAEARRQAQSRFITVSDSESDIYEVLSQATRGPANCHWVVRACRDRALDPDFASETGGASDMRAELLKAPVFYTQTVFVRGRKAKLSRETRARRQSRESREAEVEVRAARLTLRGPYRPGRKLPSIELNAVLAREVAPPEGEPAVEWILLTDLPIDDVEQVRAIIEYYTTRWMIEIFFRTLKSGCRAEDRRFEHIDRLLPCLAMYLIVTWRTLFVCHLGRECPDISCEAVFEPAEWKSSYRIVHGATPRTPPNLEEMVRTVAQLGGYVNRKRSDPPGPQTVWLGLQRLHDITVCWKTFGPQAQDASRLV
jgi:Transposase DNA-binding/Transposase Tn5 dimerisation domain